VPASRQRRLLSVYDITWITASQAALHVQMKVQTLVARNIRRLRVARQISQDAFAVDAEIDRAYLSRLETAQENPTILILERLATALGVEVGELFRKPEPGEKEPMTLRSGRKPGREA
jgi:transcriptional regulator with XRE-family HTH domain